jgi:RES domain
MSLPIWTPAELSSEFKSYERPVWRLVEAQHYVSTRKLVDSRAEQELLEDLIEETKPATPIECRHLDFLLSTPFRYGSAYPKGSRFRRAGRTDGVFYASEEPSTAVAEMAFFRLLFFAESPTTPWPTNAADFTGFAAAVASSRSLDLTASSLVRDKSAWIDPLEYEPCQALADAARAVETEIIRYESVRDPNRCANVAVLKCHAFAKPNPIDHQTWRIRLSATGAQAFCESPRQWIEFDRRTFANDPRIARMTWDR